MAGQTIEFHLAADAEVESAMDWYAERSSAAAERFLDELDRALQEISDAPDRCPRHLYGTRRFLMKRFPYIVVYREKSASILEIVAVAHGHRRPGYWWQRVED